MNPATIATIAIDAGAFLVGAAVTYTVARLSYHQGHRRATAAAARDAGDTWDRHADNYAVVLAALRRLEHDLGPAGDRQPTATEAFEALHAAGDTITAGARRALGVPPERAWLTPDRKRRVMATNRGIHAEEQPDGTVELTVDDTTLCFADVTDFGRFVHQLQALSGKLWTNHKPSANKRDT